MTDPTALILETLTSIRKDLTRIQVETAMIRADLDNALQGEYETGYHEGEKARHLTIV